MTKYEELKQKAENYKHRLKYGIAYRDNLENGLIVTNGNGSPLSGTSPFKPYLSNRVSGSYGYVEADMFSEEEMGMLKAVVRSHVERLKLLHDEAAVKLLAVEELLT